MREEFQWSISDGVVFFKDSKKTVKAVNMCYMWDMEGMWRCETAPPVEDRFFRGAYDCEVITKAGIFAPDGKKMVLYWPANDKKRGGRTPIAISGTGDTYALEHGVVPPQALAGGSAGKQGAAKGASRAKRAETAQSPAAPDVVSTDPVGEIAEKKSGKNYHCETIVYDTRARTWQCERADGSVLKFGANAVSVRTPAGGIWYEKGLLIGPPRGPIIAVNISSDTSWSINKASNVKDNLGKATIKESGKSFRVEDNFFHNKLTGDWCIYTEDSSQGRIIWPPQDVDIETGAGFFDLEGDNLKIRWKKDDPMRKNRRPIIIQSQGTTLRFFRTEKAK